MHGPTLSDSPAPKKKKKNKAWRKLAANQEKKHTPPAACVPQGWHAEGNRMSVTNCHISCRLFKCRKQKLIAQAHRQDTELIRASTNSRVISVIATTLVSRHLVSISIPISISMHGTGTRNATRLDTSCSNVTHVVFIH